MTLPKRHCEGGDRLRAGRHHRHPGRRVADKLAPGVVESLAAVSLEPYPASPQQLASLLKNETDCWSGLLRTVG